MNERKGIALLGIVLNFLAAILFLIGGILNELPLNFVASIMFSISGIAAVVRYHRNK